MYAFNAQVLWNSLIIFRFFLIKKVSYTCAVYFGSKDLLLYLSPLLFKWCFDKMYTFILWSKNQINFNANCLFSCWPVEVLLWMMENCCGHQRSLYSNEVSLYLSVTNEMFEYNYTIQLEKAYVAAMVLGVQVVDLWNLVWNFLSRIRVTRALPSKLDRVSTPSNPNWKRIA